MRWLDKLDAIGERFDRAYWAWLNRHAQPVIDRLVALAVPIIGVIVALLLLFRLTQ